MLDIPISAALLAAWGSYFYWTTLLPDSDKMSYGLQMGCLAVMMALFLVSGLTVLLGKGLLALGIVLSPIILGFLLYFFVRWFTSLLFVFNDWFYQSSNVSKECCRLCAKCQSIIERSPLLIGSKWLFSRSTERHAFYTKEELEESARNCHMCVLVLKSVEEFSKSAEKTMTKSNCGLTLIIRYRWPKLELELSGPSISKARRVPVKRNKNWSSEYRSKYSHSLFAG